MSDFQNPQENVTLGDLERSYQGHESEKRQYLCERQSNRIIKILEVDAKRATALCEQFELKSTQLYDFILLKMLRKELCKSKGI